MQFCFANSEDIPALISLWHDLYNDSFEYIQLFFDKRFSSAKAFVAKEKNEITAVMYLLPCELKDATPAYYWYAGGTAKKWRNKGVFRNLICEIKKISAKEGRASCCVPGKGLLEFYKKMGLSYPYYRKRIQETRNAFHPSLFRVKIEQATANDFMQLSLSQGSTVWDRSAIEYALSENRASGGENIKIITPIGDYPALVQKNKRQIIISESTLPQHLLKPVSKDLFDYFNCDHISFLTEAGETDSDSDDDFITGLSDCILVNRKSTLTFPMI